MNPNINYASMYYSGWFVQPFMYYYLTFQTCPSKIEIDKVDKKKLYPLLLEKYHVSSNNIIKGEWFDHDKNEMDHTDVLLEIGNSCLIYFNVNAGCYIGDKQVQIIYSHLTSSSLLEEVENVIKSCIESEEVKSEINLICKYDNGGLGLNSFEIPKLNLDLHLNYNDDFMEIDQIIKTRLSKPKDKGIVLLHGLPGTGKTNYIRHLLTAINKKMIYLPPDLAFEIGSPGFLSFLTDNPDSILIIEDAENVVMKRTGGSNGAISNLLNLCDGLLSDCLNIQVICSFNTDISKIDEALMRKGRMIADYEFKKLTVTKAQLLSDSLGFSKLITEEMSVSEIYNQNDKEFSTTEHRLIGFARNKIVA